MDIEKEREAFQKFCEENFDFERHEQTYFDEQTQCYENDIGEDTESINMAWSAWQAAKAQAVQEGFVLVPKEPTDAMLFAASGRDIVAEHYGDENIMWPELRETWKAMLEAARGGK